MTDATFIFNICVMFVSATSCAWASENMTCPATVRLESGALVPSDVPVGNRVVFSKSIIRLDGASIFDGPPEKGGVLKPFSSSANDERAEWIFEKGAKYDVWMSCDYAGGLIRLARRVKEPVASCTVIARNEGSTKVLGVKFTCI